MTVQPYSPAEIAPRGPLESVGAIVQWAQDISTAAKAIALIVDTPFFPLSFWPMPKGVSLRDFPAPQMRHPRESEDEFAARREIAVASGASAVVTGNEVGFTPQASLSAIYVVRGKPGMYAEAMAALVKSHGHQLVIEELTDRICRVRGRRRGDEDWQRFEFTIDRARRAGYVKQNAKYENDPQAMLLPRALSIAARAIAPDVIKGLASVEEIEDDQPVTVTAEPRTRAVRRADAVAPAPARAGLPVAAMAPQAAPAAQPPLPGEDEPTADAAPIEADQWRAINARFVELHVSGPGKTAKRMTVVSSIIGRTLTRGGEMTATEASLVLDSLAGSAGDRVVADVLGADALADDEPDAPAVAEQAPAVAEPSGPPLPDEAEALPDPTVGDDPWATAEQQ